MVLAQATNRQWPLSLQQLLHFEERGSLKCSHRSNFRTNADKLINIGETLDERTHTDKLDLDLVEIARLSCFTE